MPLCPACGHENPDGAKFCSECGTALAAVSVAPGVSAPLPAEEERKVVTALFTDIVGSTATAEQLDVEDVRARLAPYYARVRRELESFGGVVEKFIGDAVVALFGAPVAHEDDPERAVRAALAIKRAVSELNEQDSWLDLHIRTAVHTGAALVVMGAKAIEGEGMAAGDVMNTAARIQGGASPDGIVVGEATYRATKDLFDYSEAEPVQAKGKTEPIPIWEVLGEKAPRERRNSRTLLVGRERELELLRSVWQRALTERRVQLVTLLAPAGIGKTSLVHAFCEGVGDSAGVHWGRCLSYGEGMTYWPVAEILKDAAGILHDDDAETGSAKLGALLERLDTENEDELRTMAAALANVVGAPTTPRGTYSAVEISQAELQWGIRRVLHLLAAERPLLLVFEDLHWAEPTLLELISQLADGDFPLVVVSTARPELEEAQPEHVVAGPNRHVLHVEALSEAASRALLAELVGDDPDAVTKLDRLLEHAAGNPLFLEETVRMLADAELAAGSITLESLPVPDSLNALIGARLDALATTEKKVAQQASVVGGTFWAGAVAHLHGGGDLTPSLQALERHDFVHPRRDSAVAGEREYAFKHILIRDVAYERLPKGRRAELHVRFSEWLRSLPGPEEEFVEILAYHLEQACHHARAIARSPIEPPVLQAADALRRSAEKAERREGYPEAGRFYSRALELLRDEHADTAAEIRLRHARALAATGELKQACEELTALLEEGEPVRPDVRSMALVTLGNIDHRQGRVGDALDRLAEGYAMANELGETSLQIRAGFGLSTVRADFDGAAAEAADDLRRAIRLAEQIDDVTLRIEGHLRLGFLLFNMGDLSGSEEELVRCSDLASQLGSRRDETRAAFLLGLVKYYRGDVETAERLNLQARDWLERTGESFFQLQNFRALGVYALAHDDPDAAEEWLRNAIPVALEEGGREILEVYQLLTETLVRQGRIDDAAALVGFAGRDVPEDPAAEAYVLLARGAVAAATGEERQARECFEEALRRLERQNRPLEVGEARIAYARALRRLSRTAEVRVELERARDILESVGATGLVAEINRELALVAGGAG